MKSIIAYRAARRTAIEARALLVAQALDTRDRLMPRRLLSDAVDEATAQISASARRGLTAARTNPGKLGIAAVLLASWFARRRLARIAVAALDGLSNRTRQTDRVDETSVERDGHHGTVSEYSSDDGKDAAEADEDVAHCVTPQIAANDAADDDTDNVTGEVTGDAGQDAANEDD